MPIVVAILGVVIVVMGAVLFLMPSEQAEAPVTAIEEPANRTEAMEQEEIVPEISNTLPEADAVSTLDTPAITMQKGVATYLTPARTEHEITVELTLTGDTVTEANVLYDGQETSQNPNHERFDAAYKTEVVGKTLAQISLSRVGGASLTSQAFNEAVAKMIATQS
jgi:FMN-binding domain